MISALSFFEPLLGSSATELPSALLMAEGSAGSPFGSMLPLLLIFGIFYFLVLRPQTNQDQERRNRLADLKQGDKVVLSGGIIGRVSSLGDDGVAVVEVADKVKLKVFRKDINDLLEFAMKAESERNKNAKGKAKDKESDKDSNKAEESARAK